MALSTAMTTTICADTARLLKIGSPTKNIPASANTVVVPAKTIALPDVPIATRSASSRVRPARISLR